MRNQTTWVSDGRFLKRYPTAAAAMIAWNRSLAAAAAGVPTPSVHGRIGHMVLSFHKVDVQGKASLAEMVALSLQLHGMPQGDLIRFDPFLRIRPRLATAPTKVGLLIDDLATRDVALRWQETAAIHGDFHPGQVIRDTADKVWLIDLDDMATGPPEADLGNVAAWLATQKAGQLSGLAEGALAEVLVLSPGSDPALVAHFCAVALIRRALKLAERGERWALDQVAQWTYPRGREMSYFSIR